MRRFYAPPESFRGEEIVLTLEESSHLRDVLRLRARAQVLAFDGSGNQFLCCIEKTGGRKEAAVLRILEKLPDGKADSPLDFALAVALLKGEKFDLVVQKACELGVSRLIPIETRRADAKIKDARDAEKKLERWRKIAVEAAKQCGRTRLMNVEAPGSFENLLQTRAETSVLFAERGGESFRDFAQHGVQPARILAVVGAEGGWEDAELEAARKAGFQILTLGGRILRAETAAIAVAALVQNRFGDLQ